MTHLLASFVKWLKHLAANWRLILSNHHCISREDLEAFLLRINYVTDKMGDIRLELAQREPEISRVIDEELNLELSAMKGQVRHWLNK